MAARTGADWRPGKGRPRNGRSALAEAALERAAEGFIGMDGEGRVVLCNPAAAALLGIAPSGLWRPAPLAAVLARSTTLDPVSATALAHALWHGAPPGEIAQADGSVLLVAVDGTTGDYRLASLRLKPAPGRGGDPVDPMTVSNGGKDFHDRLTAMLPGPVALLLIGLDRFRAVNDSHGHPVGDALLQVVAKRIRSVVREEDVVSRLGSDEFAVAMRNPAAAQGMGARLVDLLSRPYLIQGHVITVGASAGLATGPQDGADAASLARAAVLALLQAKADGRGTVQVFNGAMETHSRERRQLEDDLRRALALQQFEVHYQPQLSLDDDGLAGFEALVRWRHPERGLVPPDQFIPLAEELGLIVPLGEWVLRTACREAASWPAHLWVAVNVSAKQLADRDRLPRAVAAALAAAGLPGHRLEVEITESALARNEVDALHVLHALHKLGVRISMDDFGTGYSSLSQLRSFPFDKLKIDRSFVRDLASSTEAVAMVRAISALGASLGMTTTAEGVETADQKRVVAADGCTSIQGYLVSRPVPAADLPGLIAKLTPATSAIAERIS